MKKLFVLFLTIMTVCSVLLVGCGNKTESVDIPQNTDNIIQTDKAPTDDGPPAKENKPNNTKEEGQYVRNGKLYLGELYVFDFTSTANGESRPGWSHKVRVDDIAKQLEPYKVADVHNDAIEQCILAIVELRIISPEDIFHLKNGDTVVWETTINQAKLDEFNSYIKGIEIIVDPTYTITVQGLDE